MLALSAPSVAFADAAADAALAQVDEAMNRFQDQYLRFEVKNLEPGRKEPKQMVFETKVLGVKSFTEFLEPGDVKGTKVLVIDEKQMYVYVPELRKIRRVASHTLEQGFMGTTLSQQDMSLRRYAPVFDGTIASQTDTEIVFDLKPKAGVEIGYAGLRLTVEKARNLPTKLEWLAQDGSVSKVEVRSEYMCEGEVCTPGVMKVTDNTRNGAWTELRVVDWKVNTGMSESMFTPRELQAGN